MDKPNNQITLQEHIGQLSQLVPAGTRVSIECRVKWDRKTKGYIVQGDNWSGNAILLRFSIVVPKGNYDGGN